MSAGTLCGVAVVGSANLDIVVTLDRVPERGETVFGTAYDEQPGGKGANQSIAAGRLVETSFVGSLGVDDAGDQLLSHLASRGVKTAHVARVPAPTGRAYITVTPDGENAIAVLPLANSELEAHAVAGALDRERPAVVLSQRESPDAAISAAAEWCVRNGARFILNASPTAPVPDLLLAASDPLIVNAEEARGILGLGADAHRSARELARDLLRLCRSAVLTAGRQGAYVARAGTVTHIPANETIAVDTTGAGDEFAGTLAAQLSLGVPLLEAAMRATAAASALITVPRAQR